MDAMPTDENQQMFRMDEFQQFPQYAMPQPMLPPQMTQMPWEAYGIMMNPFYRGVDTTMMRLPEVRPLYHQELEKKAAIDAASAKNAVQGPDAVRSKLRDSLTEALKMVANEQSRDKIATFLNGGKDVETAVICKMNYESEMSDAYLMQEEAEEAEAEAFSAKGRSKLQVFGGKGSPFKRMRLDGDEVEDCTGWDERVTEHAKQTAKAIEIELLRVFRAVNKKYREKARSLVFNLKDKNNPELRARVFAGEITPENLCSMTIEQLASKELSQWRMAKAEELAQMVVITDEDVNPSKIVKKTHKGEVIMEVDNDVPDVSAPTLKSVSVGVNSDGKKTEKPVDAEQLEGGADKVDLQGFPEVAPQIDSAVAAVESEDPQGSTDVLLDVADFKGLPEIMSMDGFLKALGSNLREDGTVSEEMNGASVTNKLPEGVGDEKKKPSIEETKESGEGSIEEKRESGECNIEEKKEATEGKDELMEDASKEATEGKDEVMEDASKENTEGPLEDSADQNKLSEDKQASDGNSLKRKQPDSDRDDTENTGSVKLGDKSPIKEDIVAEGQQSTESQEGPVWDGSLQLTGVRSSAVHAIFRSGQQVKLNGWPKLLEVKGRVKLGPLAKFLRDLSLSKSRAVTAVSFYSSDSAASSVAHLKEVAGQYQKGERVGYVEPATGFELYLFPPGNSTWKFLTDNGRLKPTADSVPKEKSEVLVGCIVWRRNRSDKSSDKRSSSDKIKKSSSSSRTGEKPRSPSSKASASRSKQGSSRVSAAAAAAASAAAVSSSATPSVKISASSSSVPSSVQVNVSSDLSLQSQSVVKHSVNEWHQTSLASPTPVEQGGQQQQQQQQGLLGLPLRNGLDGRPPGFGSHQLSTALSALLPGSKLPGSEGPPGFWQQGMQDDDDLPEYDYEGHVPMSTGSFNQGTSAGLDFSSQGTAAVFQGVAGGQVQVQQVQQQQQGFHPSEPSLAYGSAAGGQNEAIQAQFGGNMSHFGGEGIPPEWSRAGPVEYGRQQSVEGDVHHHHLVTSNNTQQQQGGAGFSPPLRPPMPPTSRPGAPPLPPGPPPAVAAAAAGASQVGYGQWVHPNQIAQQKSLYKKTSSSSNTPSQRRYRN